MRQIDKKVTKQIRVDEGYHRLLKLEAAESGVTIKEVAEDCFSVRYAVDKGGVYGKTKNK